MEANYEAVLTLPEPESPLAAELHYYRGRRARREGRLDEAVFFLSEATGAAPNRVDYHKQYAELLFEAGEVDHANDIWKRVRELDPNETDALYHLASNLTYISQYEEAVEYAEQYLVEAPQGKYAETIQSLIELIELEQEFENEEPDEDELITWHAEATRHLEKGRLFAAEEALHRLIERYPTFWPGYNNLATTQFYLGNESEAFATLEYLLQQNPGNLTAVANTVVLLHEADRGEAARALAEQLRNVRPLQIELRYKIASTLALVGFYEEAYEELRLLKERGYEGDSLFHHWLSVSAYKTARAEEAASYVEDEAMKQFEERQTFDVREQLEFRAALVQGLKQEDDVARIEIIRIISKLADEEARRALMIVPDVTDHTDVVAFAEQCLRLIDGKTPDATRAGRAMQTLLRAERFVSEEDVMQLDSDFYDRFARLLFAGESFEETVERSAALVWLFYAKRDSVLLETCAEQFDLQFDDLVQSIRQTKQLIEA